MNNLTAHQKQLLRKVKKLLDHSDIELGDGINKYLSIRIEDIIHNNIYTDEEKILLNGLRELFIEHIKSEVIIEEEDEPVLPSIPPTSSSSVPSSSDTDSFIEWNDIIKQYMDDKDKW